MASPDEASFSSQTSGLSTNYDVFLNFMGKDIRNSFVVFLQKDLKRKGLEAFIDSENLWGGEEIQPTLLEIIRGSRISIAVLSSGYADSEWPLLELEEMLRCNRSGRQMVLPIFLDVEPRDIRKQTGSFGESFQKHMEIFDPQKQKIQTWKDALKMVGEKKGIELQQVNGDLSRLVELVVNWASRQLNSQTRLKYDVFLNFSSRDTGDNFTAFLHKDLKRAGLNVFMDGEGSWVGEDMPFVLFDAIQRSKMSIIVFSVNYACSLWYMKELVECVRLHRSNGQIILPIFVDVTPSDICRQSATFERSFHIHEEVNPKDIVEKYKDALTEVANIKGFHIRRGDGNQSRVVDSIVWEVLSNLNVITRD